MKTIYTDRLGIYPWALLFLSTLSFWSAYETAVKGRSAPLGFDNGLGGLIFVLSGVFWLILAVKRLRDVLRAKQEGRDHTIIR